MIAVNYNGKLDHYIPTEQVRDDKGRWTRQRRIAKNKQKTTIYKRKINWLFLGLLAYTFGLVITELI